MEGGGQEKPENLTSEEEEEEELEVIDEDVVQLTGEEIEGLQDGLIMVAEDGPPQQWTDMHSDAAQEEEKDYDPSQDNYLLKYSAHKDAPLCIEPLPWGLVASGDCKEELHIWRRETGEQVEVLKGFKDSIVKIKLSPSGTQLAVASLDNSLRIYKIEMEEVKHESKSEEEQKSGKLPGKVKLELQHTIEGPSDDIEFLEWHNSGKVILTGGKDKAGWLFSAISGNYLQIFNGHSQQVRDGLFTPDGKSVLTISLDRRLKVWNPKTGNAKLTIEASGKDQFHTAGITCAVLSLEGGDTVFTGDQSGAIYQSSWKTGKIFGCLCMGFESEEEEDESHAIESMSVKHTGEQRWLASGSMDAHLKCYQTSKSIKWSDIELTSGVTKIQFLKAGNEAHLVAALVDGRIVLADMKAGETLKAFKGHQDTVLDFAIDEQDLITIREEQRLLSSGDDEACLVFALGAPPK